MERINYGEISYHTARFHIVHLSVLLFMTIGSLVASSNQPGLDFRPHPPKEIYERTLIWFNMSNYRTYSDILDTFLEEYKVPDYTKTIENCDYDRPAARGVTCDVNLREFEPCIAERFYGYFKSSPCVFLKLNNIPGWIPQFYNDSTKLPESMPTYLKEHIKNVELAKQNQLNTVWVTCAGETPADIEFIGPVEYYPFQGFPGYYFPMENSENYLSPLIAVHFQRAQIGIIINVECKMWAKNIAHDGAKSIGTIHFELQID